MDWFQPTITLGNLLELMVVAASVIGAIMASRYELKYLRSDVTKLQVDFGSMANALVIIARQDEQIKGLGLRVDRIERGNFLEPTSRRFVPPSR